MVKTQNQKDNWRGRLRKEFAIHLSKSELQFLEAFIEDELAKAENREAKRRKEEKCQVAKENYEAGKFSVTEKLNEWAEKQKLYKPYQSGTRIKQIQPVKNLYNYALQDFQDYLEELGKEEN